MAGILSHEPRLASSEFLWHNPATQSLAAGALLASRDKLAGRSDDIIRCALEANAAPTRPSLVEVFGPHAVMSALSWMDEKGVEKLPSGWEAALTRESNAALEWLVSRPTVRRETAYYVLTTLNLGAITSNPLLVETLRRFVEVNDSDEAAIVVAAKALRWSFSSPSHSAVDIAAVVFDIAYHAAATSHVGDEAWRELSPALPSSNWWQDWDRCERLRKPVAEKFRTGEWPAPRLVGFTQDDEVFAQIVRELRYKVSGRRVLAAAAESVDANSPRALIMSE